MAAIICLPLGAAGVISGIVTLIARLDSVGTGVELIVLSSLFLIIGFAALSSYLTKLRAIKDDDFTVREVMIEQKILDGAFGSLSLTAETDRSIFLKSAAIFSKRYLKVNMVFSFISRIRTM